MRQKPRTVRFAVTGLVIGSCLMGVVPAAAEQRVPPRTISISATGTINAEPDMARISVGVVTQAKSAKEALAANSKQFKAVVAAIRQLGIERRDIATSQFQVQPIYARQKSSRSGYRSTIDAFRVINQAVVTLRDIAVTGDAIDRAAASGANQIGAVQFIVSGLEEKLDAARNQAMRNAIRRAKLYANAAGATLAEIMTINEQRFGHHPRPVQMARRGASLSARAPIEPGQQRIGVTVNAVWKLR